jgi:hypothetical protein
LVGAIGRYERDNGRPPDSLAVLVPKYLSQVPGTGMGAYPNYEYERTSENTDPRVKQAGWELRVPCSSDPLNWDVFFYWPTRRYPTFIYGGSVKRIGEWAYVDE